ncbi:MAG: hypothetical protein ABII82_20095, partial [Verrucomicrobiota bacterium]
IFVSPPLPNAKSPGEPAEWAGFTNYYTDVTFTVFSRGIQWPEELQQDLANFEAHVKSKATEVAKYYRERLYQWRTSLMTGSAVDTGLPTITTTCYDGLSLYTSSTRYRTSGGNTITGTGVASGAQIRKDWFTALTRIASYRHEASGAKIWPAPHKLRYMIEFTPSLWEQVVEAFKAEVVTQAGGSTQSADNQFIAFAKSEGASVKLVSNAYLSGNSWYGTILGAGDRPAVLVATKDAAKAHPATMDNDGNMRARYSEGIMAHGRYGVAVAFPGSTFVVSNS